MLANSPSINLIKKLIKYYDVEVFDPLVEKLDISSSKIKKVDRLEKTLELVKKTLDHDKQMNLQQPKPLEFGKYEMT